MLKKLLQILTVFLPWPLKRRVLEKCFGFQLHPTSHIGFALAFPDRLILEEHASIGNLTVCRNLHLVHLKAYAKISRLNWVTGYPRGAGDFFTGEPDRIPQLLMGEHSAITNRHLIDCTNTVTIGKFTTFAGFHSQLLSHSIDVLENRQASRPIEIGDYCFIGTNCVFLSGSRLPSYSVLGAKSLLNKHYTEEYQLYGGVPARPLRALPRDAGYFQRQHGVVY